ncbi:MAG: hypothetical protein Q3972_01795 [Corynebacterium sp.]|nr:hypothetical protein [Corynebacterium sp.]
MNLEKVLPRAVMDWMAKATPEERRIAACALEQRNASYIRDTYGQMSPKERTAACAENPLFSKTYVTGSLLLGNALNNQELADCFLELGLNHSQSLSFLRVVKRLPIDGEVHRGPGLTEEHINFLVEFLKKSEDNNADSVLRALRLAVKQELEPLCPPKAKPQAKSTDEITLTSGSLKHEPLSPEHPTTPELHVIQRGGDANSLTIHGVSDMDLHLIYHAATAEESVEMDDTGEAPRGLGEAALGLMRRGILGEGPASPISINIVANLQNLQKRRHSAIHLNGRPYRGDQLARFIKKWRCEERLVVPGEKGELAAVLKGELSQEYKDILDNLGLDTCMMPGCDKTEDLMAIESNIEIVSGHAARLCPTHFRKVGDNPDCFRTNELFGFSMWIDPFTGKSRHKVYPHPSPAQLVFLQSITGVDMNNADAWESYCNQAPMFAEIVGRFFEDGVDLGELMANEEFRAILDEVADKKEK